MFCFSWEECKQLLLSPNFFESLKFFDKDSVPRHKLRQLKAMLKSPAWRVESLRHASRYTLMNSCEGSMPTAYPTELYPL